MSGTHVAIDLGAGSGRAFLGRVDDAGLSLQEIHRFTYGPRTSAGHLRWDMTALHAGLSMGLAAARAAAAASGRDVSSVGVDSWGVDYGLIDAAGRLVEEPIAYRDPRTDGVMDAVLARVPRSEIFARTGIQFLPINTIYQLAAHVRDGLPADAAGILMLPDLCHLFLSGSRSGEYTDASTTQLLNATTRQWDDELFTRLGLPRALMPSLVDPGGDLGAIRPALQADLGGAPIRVVVPATHDTASAVVGTPLTPGWAYISSGTWSLVGVERATPLLTAAAEAENFTNEGGAGGTIRFLKNVMGLWILEGCRREWGSAAPDIDALVAGAAARPGPVGVIDVDDFGLLNPPSMIAAIHAQLTATGQRLPETPIELARVVFDSLALGYARVVAAIEHLTGASIAGIHVVGGGSRNAFLNQATADATGKPVLAGPVEATAAGNVIVQAIAAGSLASIAEGRAAIARAVSLRRYEPVASDRWAELAGRLVGRRRSSSPRDR
ncbi:MAG: rhamnulokinase family protein [Vicinamibacteraceae bacterium]